MLFTTLPGQVVTEGVKIKYLSVTVSRPIGRVCQLFIVYLYKIISEH